MTRIDGAVAAPDLSAQELAAIEEEYDEASRSRTLTPNLQRLLSIVALAYALYHFITAGFGLPVDYWHMGWHLCGLFVLR